MFSLFRAARRLRQLGVLGMNRRNACYILDHNPRSAFPIVDDKLRMHELCADIGVPTPRLYAVVNSFGALRCLARLFAKLDDFVIKPNHGSGGKGILVIAGKQGDRFLRHNGDSLSLEDLRQHLSDILSGMYSLGGHPDAALVQQRITLHPALAPVAYKGLPDLRVILFKQQPVMAMLRLPTKAACGRANLHQGGIGVGVDLASGQTHHAVHRGRSIETHPDTGASLLGLRIPDWPKILEMSQRVAAAVRLGYVGVDLVIDANAGPMLLEANARPGLAIQLANAAGLWRRLAEIEAEVTR